MKLLELFIPCFLCPFLILRSAFSSRGTVIQEQGANICKNLLLCAVFFEKLTGGLNAQRGAFDEIIP